MSEGEKTRAMAAMAKAKLQRITLEN